MRQHSCHSAAAWSAAGVPAGGGGRRAERLRACRAASGATRPLPRCAAPRAHLCPMPGCRSPPAPIAAQVAGVRAAGDGGALPRAIARRAGSGGGAGCYCHVLVPRATAARAHRQSQRLAVRRWMLTPHLFTCMLVDQLVWTLVASFVNNRKMRSRCDVISGSLCSLVHTRTATHVTHRFHITISPHTTHTRHTPTSHIR